MPWQAIPWTVKSQFQEKVFFLMLESVPAFPTAEKNKSMSIEG